MTIDWSDAGIFVMLVGWVCLFIWVSRAEPDPWHDWPSLEDEQAAWRARTGPHDNMTESSDFDRDYSPFMDSDDPPRAA